MRGKIITIAEIAIHKFEINVSDIFTSDDILNNSVPKRIAIGLKSSVLNISHKFFEITNKTKEIETKEKK